jgi:hypothetical protein
MITRIAEDQKLGKRLVRGHPMLEAEVIYAVRHEMCERPDDFIARRTRLAFLDVAATEQALPRVRMSRSTVLGLPIILYAPCHGCCSCSCCRFTIGVCRPRYCKGLGGESCGNFFRRSQSDAQLVGCLTIL